MDASAPLDRSERVLSAERAFILALGGFSLGISGAELVTHERIPAPRFNYAVVGTVGPERQAAFFERTLDHYFQRALRPVILTRRPPPPHIDAGLRRFGFTLAPDPVVLLEAARPPGGIEDSGAFQVQEVPPEELDRIGAFWGRPEERAELVRSLEVLAHHPNPGESFVPLAAQRAGRDVASGIVYSDGKTAGVHAVGTAATDRGLGAASAIVRHALLHAFPDRVATVGMLVRGPRPVVRLASLGFEPVGERAEFVLPPEVDLRLPAAGPPAPPRWRPPRHRPQ
ncbi:MAG TPA: hypothetical protein VGX00_02545 [Thermoplasmata archaeon]|nr:hypothetical protein [Thermoplasmata archaeon]